MVICLLGHFRHEAGFMALDHFVSQVHLKNFYSDALGGRKMYAYRKSDLATFPCNARDVCRISDGSTNAFLTEPRILEDFLKNVEPKYNRAAQALAEERFGFNDVLVIAGFAAFVLSCSPTAMRLGASSLSKLAATEIELIERMGELPPVPPVLGVASATELVSSERLIVETDPKFPQGMGISQLPTLTKSLASYRWEIVKNPNSAATPFLTSDFPVATETPGPPAIRILPLRPDLAVRIHPVVRPPSLPDQLGDFRYRVLLASPHAVREINRSIVQSAEDFVFSPLATTGLAKLVKKYANFRLEMDHLRIPRGTGFLLLNTIRPMQRD
ncbi:MAG: hypothetical protein CL950_10605 [Erythrobacter sp.]|nr:hypothetical protein [Erythrobacter sp.]